MKKLIMVLVLGVGLLSFAETRYDQYYSASEEDMKLARQEYDKAREELDRLVARNIDEASVHAVLRMLALELQLVDKLLRDETGAKIDELLIRKRKLAESSTKTAVYLYRAVLNFATNDILFTGENGSSKLGSTLRGGDRRAYLRRMKKILGEYRNEFLDKQYNSMKQTLGLPSARYAPYVPQELQPANTDALQVGVLDECDRAGSDEQAPLFTYEPNWSFEDRYGTGAVATDSLWSEKALSLEVHAQTAHDRLKVLWRTYVMKSEPENLARLVDDVLLLLNHEMRTHVGSMTERHKMLYGALCEESTLEPVEFGQLLACVSSGARALFATLREVATEQTVKLGGWNPDVYEDCLKKYVSRLESVQPHMSGDQKPSEHVRSDVRETRVLTESFVA